MVFKFPPAQHRPGPTRSLVTPDFTLRFWHTQQGRPQVVSPAKHWPTKQFLSFRISCIKIGTNCCVPLLDFLLFLSLFCGDQSDGVCIWCLSDEAQPAGRPAGEALGASTLPPPHSGGPSHQVPAVGRDGLCFVALLHTRWLWIQVTGPASTQLKLLFWSQARSSPPKCQMFLSKERISSASPETLFLQAPDVGLPGPVPQQPQCCPEACQSC